MTRDMRELLLDSDCDDIPEIPGMHCVIVLQIWSEHRNRPLDHLDEIDAVE